jgi:hypothetical protein
MIVRY